MISIATSQEYEQFVDLVDHLLAKGISELTRTEKEQLEILTAAIKAYEKRKSLETETEQLSGTAGSNY